MALAERARWLWIAAFRTKMTRRERRVYTDEFKEQMVKLFSLSGIPRGPEPDSGQFGDPVEDFATGRVLKTARTNMTTTG